MEVEVGEAGTSAVEEVDAVLKPPGSTSASVLLYVVISTTTLPPVEICRFAKREGSSAIPPHFWAASPGQRVLHAESGYLTKSESDGVPAKEEQKHSLGFVSFSDLIREICGCGSSTCSNEPEERSSSTLSGKKGRLVGCGEMA